MPLAGGPADKLGNRYELWWTVIQFENILLGEWDSIRLEVPGIDKAEFVLTKGSERIFHQCKRNAPDGKWSLAELSSADNRVLQGMAEQLRIPGTRYVFVSSSDARDLAELSERARDSATLEEFDQYFASGKEHHQRISKLQTIWNCDLELAREYLRRIEIRVLDESSLRQQALLGAQSLFLATPRTVCSELRSMALDSVHKTLTRSDILAHLGKAGYHMRQVTSLDDAKIIVAEVTERYLTAARSRFIQGQLVPRSATNELLSLFHSAVMDSVLTGRAGTGKTGCISELVQNLRSAGTPVLAFRLDRIDSVSTTADLGKGLGLDESPALLLAAASEGRRAALVIDQLDAISTTSGRTTAFFDVVESLLNEVRGLRSRADIHVVVVCREFDWNNDRRLRKLLPAGHNHVALGKFDKAQTVAILKSAGNDPESLRPMQIDLLCLPQNLSMFLEADFTPQTPLNGVLDLYDRYWDIKRDAVARRATPTGDLWIQTIETLVTAMTAAQQLSVRRELLDSIPPSYLDQMVSEGVITRDRRAIGFGHESFFDYCFARLFVRNSDSLVRFLLGSEQHLFRRAQVRQVLQYLHEDNSSRFCAELEDLITHATIRVHVKDVALAVAANSVKITAQEWDMWMRLIQPHLKAVSSSSASHGTDELAWRHFFGSSSLFQYGLTSNVPKQWLESSNAKIVDMGLSYIRMHEARFSREAAALLIPFVGKENWKPRLVWFMQLVELNGSREMFDLFLALIEDGTLDDARGIIAVNSTFWNLLYSLSEKTPERVGEVLKSWLNRQWHTARESGDRYIRFVQDSFADQPIARAARKAPKHFVQHVFPCVVSISSDAADPGHELPRKDRVWRYITVREQGQEPKDAALSYLLESLASVAACDPSTLEEKVETLAELNTYVSNLLLLNIVAANGGYYANVAVQLLATQPWRFESGLAGNPQWFAQKAIASVCAHASAEQLCVLESAILSYVSPEEKSRFGYKRYGSARFNLLAAIPRDLRSEKAQAAFRELERKFKELAGEPERIRAGMVRSPIADEILAKLSDRAILAAINHFDAHGSRRQRHHFLKGGKLELARAVAVRAGKEPLRFAQLALQIPPETDSVYINEILQVLEKAAIDDRPKLELCSKVFREHRGDCGSALADVLGSTQDPLPDEAIHQLTWLATESDDPKEDVWNKQVPGRSSPYHGDPYAQGINTVRGRAALAIGSLILRDSDYVSRFESTIQRLTSERTEAVQSCIMFVLRAIAIHDYSKSLSLLQQCWISAPSALCSRHGYDLIRVGLGNHFASLRPYIEWMLRCSEPRYLEAGSMLACIAALTNTEAEDMADAVAVGSVEQRRAAARVASTNLSLDEFRPWCEKQLIRFFNDSDSEVRQAAGDCFRGLSHEQLETFADLIRTFCLSPAYQDNSHSLLYTLEESVERLPGIVCTACEFFLNRFGSEAADIRTGRAADGYTVSKLIFRVYHQHQNDEWATPALNVIDQLCQEGVGEVLTQLEVFDR